MTDEKSAQANAAHDQQQAQRVGESNSTDLLSCPFCGQHPRSGKAIYVDEHKSWLPEFVECKFCSIGFYQKEGAIDRWNNQTLMSEHAALEQALEELVKLKDMKDKEGFQSVEYQKRKPLAWEAARQVLNTLER